MIAFALRYGPTIAAALALAGAVWWIMSVLAENDRLSAENARLHSRIETLEWARDQAREAARVAEAYREREAARAERLDASIETLLTGDLTNAEMAIDPRITRLLACLNVHAGDAEDCARPADDPE